MITENAVLPVKDRVNKDFVNAIRNKDAHAKGSLGILKTRITEWEKKNPGKTIGDEGVYQIIQSEIKKIDQTIEAIAGKAESGHLDIVMIERSMYKSYLPEQMSEEMLSHKVMVFFELNTIEDQPVPVNMVQKVMAHFNANYKGKFDNKILKSVVDKLLKIYNEKQ